ncbi:MAG: hypothetical protein RJQ08_10665 [Salinisphaeraceae bacterium]
MLDLLNKMTVGGESLQVTYTRLDSGKVTLLVQPCLLDDPEVVTDEDAQRARARLARPVMFSGSHADVAEKFDEYVRGAGDARQSLGRSYQALTDATKDAAKSAAQAASQKAEAAKLDERGEVAKTKTTGDAVASSGAEDQETSGDSATTPSADEQKGNPGSLFD